MSETPKLQPLDFSSVRRRYKHWNDPELVLPFDTYIAKGNRLGTDVIRDAAVAAGTRSPQPGFLHLSGYGKDLVGVPADEESSATLEMKWIKGGTRVTVDLTMYLLTHTFAIPPNTRAHIPLSLKRIPGAGQSDLGVLIQFSEATFEPIESRTKPAASE